MTNTPGSERRSVVIANVLSNFKGLHGTQTLLTPISDVAMGVS
ncbi:MAG: hypothetical protein WCI85_07445 [Comamonadaceae bacterium]